MSDLDNVLLSVVSIVNDLRGRALLAEQRTEATQQELAAREAQWQAADRRWREETFAANLKFEDFRAHLVEAAGLDPWTSQEDVVAAVARNARFVAEVVEGRLVEDPAATAAPDGLPLVDTIDEALQNYVSIHQDTNSVRAPDWYIAECDCGWSTSGSQPNVKDAADEHAKDHVAHADDCTGCDGPDLIHCGETRYRPETTRPSTACPGDNGHGGAP